MKEFKYFVDSNIFLGPIAKDNLQKVKECQEFFEKLKLGKIKAFTSNLILAEIAWLSNGFYKIRKDELIKILKGILNYKNLEIVDDFNPLLALEIYQKYKIKFIDALIGSNPKIFQKKAIIISYDKDFDKIGVIRKTPAHINK